MSQDIVVPSLGESVAEATIAKWHKQEGDAVAKDELLVELETDKVTLEVNALVSGALEKITAPEGEVVEVGAVLGKIKEGAAGKASSGESKKEEKQETKAASVPSSSGGDARGMDGAGPAARKIAEETGVDTSSIQGSGKDGRITKGDVLQAASGSAAPRKESVKRQERVKMSKLRRVIAQRLKDSQNTAAILTTFNEVDMSAVMATRSQYKEGFEKRHGVKLGFMSFFVKAAIAALREFPAVNAEIKDDEIIYKHFFDIGVAVGTEQGLVVPVVRDADQLSFAEIESEINRLGQRAREGKLSMEELSGGTFTISNGGVYGSMLSTPIINPPQSGILGLHNIVQRPVAVNGEVKIRPIMYLALSYDHRIIDGKEAVSFLVRIKQAMEDPARLLLEV